MGGKKKSTVGYKYYADAHFVLCLGPIDKITKIKYGDKVAWSGATTGGTITINAGSIYGGDDGEGGISGPVDVLMGLPNQPRNSHLVSKLGAFASAYRGVVSMVFKRVYWGNANYFKAVRALGTRIHSVENGGTQWYDAKSEIAQPSGFADMNPIHIIRECIVSTDGGLGRPESLIDDANFRACADVLHAEGFGVSVEWTGDSSAMEFATDIANLIDAKPYIHPRTGLYTLKLIRDDYDIDDLPTLGPRQIRRVDDYMRPSPETLPNSVAVTYWDSGDESNVTVQSDDPAAIIAAGAIKSISKDWSAFVTSRDVAARIAQRTLTGSSSPVLTATITCTSAAADLLPGDPFLFDWPKYHDTPIVCRVVKTQRGGMIRQSVTLEIVEDVFTLDDSAAVTGGGSEWVDPSTVPLPVATVFAAEAPYFELLQRFGSTMVEDFSATTPDAGMVLATAARVTGAINALTYSDGEEWPKPSDISPTGTTGAAIGYTATALPITWAYEPQIGTHIQIGSEIMRVDSIIGGTTTVGRGCLDTVPVQHASGAVAWGWDLYATTDEVEHAAGEVIAVTAALRNNSRVGATSAATNVTMAARAIRPYPPGRLRINGAAYPATLTWGVPVVLSWASRNRITQADQLIDSEASSVTAEAGTSYTVRVYSSAGLERTYSGITTLTQTYSTADELVDGGPFMWLRFEIESVRDGYVSAQRHSVTITRVS